MPTWWNWHGGAICLCARIRECVFSTAVQRWQLVIEASISLVDGGQAVDLGVDQHGARRYDRRKTACPSKAAGEKIYVLRYSSALLAHVSTAAVTETCSQL